MSKKLNKIDKYFYQVVAFVAKKSTIIKDKEFHNFSNIWKDYFKMNESINKFLFSGEKFMPELHLKQPLFIYFIYGLLTAAVLNTKISEVEKKIPDHAKYIATPEFNKLAAGNFAARLEQANLVNKTDFDNKLISFNRKITAKKNKISRS